jgi:hypothetical protein
VDNYSPDGHFSGAAYSAAPAHKPGFFICALAGLQAGIAGVIWMFGCSVVLAFWSGRGVWSVPNLLSTVFYGDFAYQDVFLHYTWAGLALITVIYGLLGAVWGLIWKAERKPLLTFIGTITGLAVYYLFFNFVWQLANPVIPLYAPVRELQVAHILWGAALAKSPAYAARIAAAVTPPIGPPVTPPIVPPVIPPSEPPPPAFHVGNQTRDDDAQSVSGELIL